MSRQLYDASIKALFKEDADQLIPLLFPGITFLEARDIEILRMPMRADRVYHIHQNDRFRILHLEFQAGVDEDIAYRLLIYHSELLYDHKIPILSIVIYLFCCATPEPLLQEMDHDKPILNFHFNVICLWELDAQLYVQQNAVSIYTLLPAMKNADADLLLQAIDGLIEVHQKDETQLGQRLLWFQIFLHRTTTISNQEKEKVQERLDTFRKLFEEDPFVQSFGSRKKEEGKLEGKLEGKIEGQVESARDFLLDFLNTRFPVLGREMQPRIQRVNNAQKLKEAFTSVVLAADEKVARSILDNSLRME